MLGIQCFELTSRNKCSSLGARPPGQVAGLEARIIGIAEDSTAEVPALDRSQAVEMSSHQFSSCPHLKTLQIDGRT